MHDILPVLVKLLSCFGVCLGVILVVWHGLLDWLISSLIYCLLFIVAFWLFISRFLQFGGLVVWVLIVWFGWIWICSGGSFGWYFGLGCLCVLGFAWVALLWVGVLRY